MSHPNKTRGYVLEKEVETFWQGLGVKCKRVLGSGMFKAHGDELRGDVHLNGLVVECKRRKGGTGFKSLYAWFEQDDADLLVVRADRMPRLYIVPEKLMAKWAKDMGWDTTLEKEKE